MYEAPGGDELAPDRGGTEGEQDGDPAGGGNGGARAPPPHIHRHHRGPGDGTGCCPKKGGFLAPPVHYGVCRSTRGFPGTITVSHDALRSYVKDLLISFAESGFERVLILTGHAGSQHISALKEACQMALQERDLRVSLVSIFDLIDPAAVETLHDGHAGEIESSMMMAIRRDLVAELPEEHFPRRPQFLIMKSVRHLMGNGIMGDPSRATAKKGELFLQMAAEGVIRALDELESDSWRDE